MTNKNMIKVLGQMVRRDALLAALHNNTKPQGFGVMHAVPGDITGEQAAAVLKDGPLTFDYLLGRPIKCLELDNGELHPRSQALYDRDAGDGAFAAAVVQAVETTQALEAG
jgi:hypothetical protein